MSEYKPTIQLNKVSNKIEVRFDFEWNAVALIKSLPERMRRFKKRDGDSYWEVPYTPDALTRLSKLYSDQGYKLVLDKPLLAEIEQTANEMEAQQKLIPAILAVKQLKEVSDVPFLDFLKVEPFLYQKIGHKFIDATGGRCLVGDEPGLGKTLQSLSYATQKKFRTLVVVPATLRRNWASEIDKLTRDRTWAILESKDLIDKNNHPYDFTIVNYDLLTTRKRDGKKTLNPTAESIAKAAESGFFDCVIIDEGHKMKNRATGWTKFIREHLTIIPHRIILTGTPIKSRPAEFWTLLNFVDPIQWADEFAFGMRYCGGKKIVMGQKSWWDFSGASHLDELYERTTPLMIRRLKEDVLKDLPKKLYSKVVIELSPSEREEYMRLEDTLRDGENTAQQDFGIIHQLHQLTSRFKMAAMREFIDSLLEAEKKVIVFSEYIEPLRQLQSEYPKESVLLDANTKNPQKTVTERFQNDPAIKICLSGPSGYNGHTWTAATYVIILNHPWTTGDLDQATDRAHRIGQNDNVNVLQPVCEGTIDEKKLALLDSKKSVISQTLDGKEAAYERDRSVYAELVAQYKKERPAEKSKRKKKAVA